MKQFLILFSAIVITTGAFARTPPEKSEVKVIYKKDHTLYFKVDRSLVGGMVMVFNESNRLISSDHLSHTHTMIYFEDAPLGHYIIRIVKDNRELSLAYDKHAAI